MMGTSTKVIRSVVHVIAIVWHAIAQVNMHMNVLVLYSPYMTLAIVTMHMLEMLSVQPHREVLVFIE